MNYKVIISDRAKEMLGMHIRCLAQVNRPAAIKLKNRLLEEMRSLQDMPQRYPFFKENYIPANKYNKLHIENWHLMLYQIKDDTVYVDCRQDYQWLFK